MRVIEELREMHEERAVLAAVAPKYAEWHTNAILRQLPALLDVAEAAEKERRRLVEDGCDLLHDHHADCIDAEMVEADRCDRCRRLDGLDTVLARLEEAGT